MSTTSSLPDASINEHDCQQDTMRRINHWLSVLEERIQKLLQQNDPETMKPGEREQAISRHLMLTMRLLSLRLQYAKASAPTEAHAIMDVLMHETEEG